MVPISVLTYSYMPKKKHTKSGGTVPLRQTSERIRVKWPISRYAYLRSVLPVVGNHPVMRLPPKIASVLLQKHLYYTLYINIMYVLVVVLKLKFKIVKYIVFSPVDWSLVVVDSLPRPVEFCSPEH